MPPLIREDSFLIDLDPGVVATELVRSGFGPDLSGMATRMIRLFRLPTPGAPGLYLAGGQVLLSEAEAACFGQSSLSVTGNGLSLVGALASCLAEGAEWLSQAERPGDVPLTRSLPMVDEGWLGEALAQEDDIDDCVTGWSRRDCGPVALPADLMLRRAPDKRRLKPVGPLSAGVAAGFDLPDAFNRALLELIERDAAAHWWLGGRPARPVADAIIDELPLEQLRGGATGRATRLLDLTTDIGVPVCAAWSCDATGRDLAIGLAARPSLLEAAQAALLELAQMEQAAPLAVRKAAQRGPAALNEIDRRHLTRAEALVGSLPALFPKGAPADRDRMPTGDLAGHLDRLGCPTFSLNLTREDLRVPVVRAICPALQPFAMTPMTERFAALRQAIPGHQPPAVPLF